MTNIHPKIISSIDNMISDAIINMQYYGEFCQFINFKSDLNIPTCGVDVNLQGMSFYYNDDFIDNLMQEEMNFVMLHEIFHLLFDHQSRILRGGYEQDLSNVVQDMIINNIIIIDVIIKIKKDYNNKKIIFAEPPKDNKGKIYVYTKPVEYKGQMIFEELYDWMIEQKNLYKQWKNSGKIEKCPISDYIKKILEDIESYDVPILDKHLSSDVPDEFKKDLINSIKKELKSRGLETDDVKYILNKLIKQKKDYTKKIKIETNELFGYHKNKSITKRNRRSIPGLKGKRKESYSLNVILDTSTSMKGYFEKILSYIFQNDIVINLIQIDTEVKSFNIIKNKKQLKNLNIKGLGGTKLTPGIQYIVSNKKLKKLNLLILTDGFTEILNFVGYYGKVLILSVGKKCEYKNSKKIKQIIIEN